MSAITDIQKRLDSLAYKICTVDREVDDLLTSEILEALRNANFPSGTNVYATQSDLFAIGVGTNIFVTDTYSSLPLASSNSGFYYWVENSQGTSWLPGSLGGTYYPKGLYYSNGTTWVTVDSPINATQTEVDSGVNDNKFVTPKTLKNRIDNITFSENYLHDQGIPSATWVVSHNLGKYPSVTVIDSANREVVGEVIHTSTNQTILNFNNPFSGRATLN